MTKELSPAAQAVLDAATNVKHPEIEAVAFQCTRLEVAAALRAVVKYTKKQKVLRTFGVPMVKGPVYCLESTLLAIAIELEGTDG